MPDLSETIPVTQEATVVVAPSKSKRHILLVIALILIICLLSLFLGIKIGQMKNLNIPFLGFTQSKPSQTLWTNQSAAIRGKILKVDGNILTVKNNYDISGKVILSQKVSIFKDNYSSPSFDTNQIDLDKDVLLLLKNIKGNYQVTSILYASQKNSLPQKASSSAVLKQQ